MTRPRWRHAVWLVLVPAALNALTGPYLALAGENATAFEEGTGEDHAAFQAAYPRVLDTMDTQERLVGALLTAFSVLAVAVAWLHHRRGDKDTWVALALVPLGFAAVTTVMLAKGVTDLGAYYAGVTLVAAAGVLLARGTPVHTPGAAGVASRP